MVYDCLMTEWCDNYGGVEYVYTLFCGAKVWCAGVEYECDVAAVTSHKYLPSLLYCTVLPFLYNVFQPTHSLVWWWSPSVLSTILRSISPTILLANCTAYLFFSVVCQCILVTFLIFCYGVYVVVLDSLPLYRFSLPFSH